MAAPPLLSIVLALVPSGSPNAAERRSLFSALRRERQPTVIANRIKALRPLQNEFEFAQCINAWSVAKSWQSAISELDGYVSWIDSAAAKVPESGSYDIVPFNACLKACANSGRWNEALGTLDKMCETQGVKPDIISYNTCIMSCARDGNGHWEDANNLLMQMRERGLTPTIRTYNACLASCAKGGHWRSALDLLDELNTPAAREERTAADAETDVLNFNAAISACARGGTWRDALGVLDKMESYGSAPTSSSYQLAMQAVAAAGELEEGVRASPSKPLAPQDENLLLYYMC